MWAGAPALKPRGKVLAAVAPAARGTSLVSDRSFVDVSWGFFDGRRARAYFATPRAAGTPTTTEVRRCGERRFAEKVNVVVVPLSISKEHALKDERISQRGSAVEAEFLQPRNQEGFKEDSLADLAGHGHARSADDDTQRKHAPQMQASFVDAFILVLVVPFVCWRRALDGVGGMRRA